LELDLETRTLHRGDRSYHMTPKECRLLATFITHEGQVLTRQFLMKEVWDTEFVADTRTLEVHIHWLRRKIEADRGGPRLLHTVRGVGYVLRPRPRPRS
jgi:DNA-binding response OmpR family regulator